MLDGSGKYYFLEMNTRLQVEHPITEAVTDVDLVREQLYIAAGERLRIAQKDVEPRGHAIEVRVYAEDAAHGFLPSIGRITEFAPPTGPGLRVDAGVETGSDVTIDYDPMLAKLIAYDRTRDACIERMSAALDDFIVGGVTTNVAFLRWLVGHDAFRRGATTTSFIDEHFRPDMLRAGIHDDVAMLAAAAAAVAQAPGVSGSAPVWRRFGAWRHSAEPRSVSFAGVEKSIVVSLGSDGLWTCKSGNEEALVSFNSSSSTIAHAGAMTRFSAWSSRGKISVAIGGLVREFALLAPPTTEAAGHGHGQGSGAGVVEAPMSGKIVKTTVNAGDEVSARDVLVVMEAMKMEHTIVAPYDAVVRSVDVTAGDTVGAGDVLVALEASA